jgi:hypothetical protein
MEHLDVELSLRSSCLDLPGPYLNALMLFWTHANKELQRVQQPTFILV